MINYINTYIQHNTYLLDGDLRMVEISWTATEILEIIATILFIVSLFFALRIHSKYPKLSGSSWITVCYGLILLTIHSFADFLDSIDWGDNNMIRDIFNIIDGLTYIFGLIFIAVGIVLISKRGQEIWGNA